MHIRLRFWALCQFLYDMWTMPPSDGGDDTEKRMVDEVLETLKTGHLTGRCFNGIADRLPCADERNVRFTDPTLLSEAASQLQEYRRMGSRKSGLLAGYCRAQHGHLARCGRCRGFVADYIREELRLRRAIDPLLAPEREAYRAYKRTLN